MYLLVSVKDIKRSENTFFPPSLQTQRWSERRRTSHFPVRAGPEHFFSALCFVLPVEHTLFRLVFFSSYVGSGLAMAIGKDINEQ